MKPTDIRARIFAVVTGVALFLLLAFATESQPGRSLLMLFAFYIGTYSLAGIAIGFIWPNSGWRLGLYLFAVWPPVILLNFLFSDPPPVIHWKEELVGLFAYLLILPGATFGAWVGSIIRRRHTSNRESLGVKRPLRRS